MPIILLLFLGAIFLEVHLSSKVREGNWQPWKLFQMTPRKMKIMGTVLLLIPLSMVAIFVLVNMRWLIQYYLLVVFITIVAGFIPFVAMVIRFFVERKNPVGFYPVISMVILKVILAVYLMMIISAPLDAMNRQQASRSPEITSGEFPFRVVYELEGTTHVMEDVLICEFAGHEQGTGRRRWRWRLRYDVEATPVDGFRDTLLLLEGEDMPSIFAPDRINERFRVFVDAGTCSHYMGDRHSWSRGPLIQIQERLFAADGGPGRSIRDMDLTFEQLEEHFGIYIIEFSFSDPIENRFN